MSRFELTPIDGRKSFYSKCFVTEYAPKYAILTSYKTEVAAIKNGELVRMWDGYSNTTQRHIKAFCNHYGVEAPTPTEWKKMSVSTKNPIMDIIKAVHG